MEVKMKIAGIICEYNPFHNGHRYHIDAVRNNGATHVVCVMSGNFVQRGECAFADKWTRAKIAVLGGADLVVELPTPWACSAAENFARGGVSLMKALGIDFLSFGCETEDERILRGAAKAVDSPEFSKIVRKKISEGMTYPRALQEGMRPVFGLDISNVFSLPNNTLAVEYIRQSEKLGCSFSFLPIQRSFAQHDCPSPKKGSITSAFSIRNFDLIEKASPFISPETLGELLLQRERGFFPCKLEAADRTVIALLRTYTLDDFKKFVPDSNGLANRIFFSSRKAETIRELIYDVKVKNYTQAAVRRAVMLSFLGIKKELSAGGVPYIKVLAANERGLEVLRRKEVSLPIITRKKDAEKLSERGKEIYWLECECTDKFSLFSKRIAPCSREQTSRIYIQKEPRC